MTPNKLFRNYTGQAIQNSKILIIGLFSLLFAFSAFAAVSGDLNNDSKVDVVDLGILLSAWNRTDKPPADLNQDARVDVVDLGIMLSNWGSGVSVSPPPSAGSASCLSQSGPLITLSGAQGSYSRTNLSSDTKIDASAASWIGQFNNAVKIGGGSNICWSGGKITGTYPDGTSWSAYHDAYSIIFYSAPGIVIENLRIHNYGDGPNFNNSGSDNWVIRNNHLSYIHDDCISNDFGNAGLVEDNLIDGCYVGYSSRAYSSVNDNRNKVVTLRNNLWRLQDMPTGYSKPGHGRFWKMNSNDGSGSDPRLALHNNIFRMDTPPNCCGDFLIPPPAYLESCSNNVMVWLGSGDFPEPLPGCFTLTRDKSVWDNAVADWQNRHPNVAQ